MRVSCCADQSPCVCAAPADALQCGPVAGFDFPRLDRTSAFVYAPQFVNNEQDSTKRDRAVGHIKGREMAPIRPMEVEKVDHMAIQDAIDHITQGTAGDQGYGPAEQ